MDIWRIYNYLVNVVHAYMTKHNQCLYNAITLTFADQSTDELLAVRNSAYALIDWINEEVGTRANEDEHEHKHKHEDEDEDEDEERWRS